jgi:hypothetical protein
MKTTVLLPNFDCFGHSDNPEKLKIILDSCVFQYIDTGVKKYFPEDKEERRTLRISIKRGEKCISFSFGMSLDETKQNRRPNLYDIIACMSSDYHCPATFPEFCGEYDYNVDSIKDFKLFHVSLKHAEKLHKIFTEEEISVFPS